MQSDKLKPIDYFCMGNYRFNLIKKKSFYAGLHLSDPALYTDAIILTDMVSQEKIELNFLQKDKRLIQINHRAINPNIPEENCSSPSYYNVSYKHFSPHSLLQGKFYQAALPPHHGTLGKEVIYDDDGTLYDISGNENIDKKFHDFIDEYKMMAMLNSALLNQNDDTISGKMQAAKGKMLEYLEANMERPMVQIGSNVALPPQVCKINS